jgi:hypothetical protein
LGYTPFLAEDQQMADVYIVALSIIGILISLPGLLVALSLLLPRATGHAATRLARTPGKCFFLGVPVTAAFLLFIAITAQFNAGPVRALSFLAAFTAMGVGSIGGAGMAQLLGDRLGRIASPNSRLTNLIRGAVVYELACLFPLVGWFLFIPLAAITVMGAAVFGLLGWIPAPKVVVGQTVVGQVA